MSKKNCKKDGAKSFDILATSLNVLHNYFYGLTTFSVTHKNFKHLKLETDLKTKKIL